MGTVRKQRSKVAVFAIFLIIAALAAASAPQRAYAWLCSENFSRGFTVTGSERQDMVNAALAQAGMTASQLGYDKTYADENWSGAFISDCADAAGCQGTIPGNGAVMYVELGALRKGGRLITGTADTGVMRRVLGTNYDDSLLLRNSLPRGGDIVIYCDTVTEQLDFGGVMMNSSYAVVVDGNTVTIADKDAYAAKKGAVYWYLRPAYKNSPDITAPVVNSVTAEFDIAQNAFLAEADIADDEDIAKAVLLVWNGNSQQNAVSYTMNLTGNTATCLVPLSKHNNRSGLYHFTVTAYDSAGNTGKGSTQGYPSHYIQGNASPSKGGRVDLAKNSAAEGSSVKAEAVPAAGYNFTGWKISGTGASLAKTGELTANVTVGTSDVVVTAEFEPIVYKIKGAVSPEKGGEIAVSADEGTVTEKIAIEAVPAAGYSFAGWSISGKGASVNKLYEAKTYLTVGTEDITVTARFTKIPYSVTPKASPSEGGTVNVSSYSAGVEDTVTATAYPNSGYFLTGWLITRGNTTEFLDADGNSAEIVMGTENITVTAKFARYVYSITTETSPPNKGRVELSSDSGAAGDKIEAEAIPAAGYSFAKWQVSGAKVSDERSEKTVLTVGSSPVTLTAVFVKNTYKVNVNITPSEGGTVTSLPAAAETGDYVKLTAFPNAGYFLSAWVIEDGDSVTFDYNKNADNEIEILVTSSDINVTARFSKRAYSIQAFAVPAAGGTVELSANGGEAGDKITAEAIPAAGYSFGGWTVSGTGASITKGASAVLTVGTEPVILTAEFTKNAYSVKAKASPAGGGSVYISASAANTGDTVSLRADPAPGYYFTGWTVTEGDGAFISGNTGDGDILTVGTGNVTVTANFSKDIYSVTAVSLPAEGGEVLLGANSGNTGSTMTVKAVPAPGYKFTGWRISGTGAGLSSYTALQTILTVGTSPVTVTADFEQSYYSMSGTASPAAGGEVTASAATARKGDTVIFTAVPKAGWQLSGWSLSNSSDAKIVDTSASTATVTVGTGNVTAIAGFEKTVYSVSADSSNAEGGTVTLSKTNGSIGDKITVKAFPASGYMFAGWKLAGTDAVISDSESATATVTVGTSPVNITAEFVLAVPEIYEEPADVTGRTFGSAEIRLTVKGNVKECTWQESSGSGFKPARGKCTLTPKAAASTSPAVAVITLKLTDLDPKMNGYRYRCIIYGDNDTYVISKEVRLSVILPEKFTVSDVEDMTIEECISYVNYFSDSSSVLTKAQLAAVKRVIAYDNKK